LNTDNKQNKAKNIRKWRLLGYLMLGFVLLILYFIWQIGSHPIFFSDGFSPPEMARAKYTPKDVVGSLGGMKLEMPRYYAEFVQYEGDPGFGKKRTGSRPERSVDSRLESFGMDVHFPDMRGLVDWKTRQEKKHQPLREKTWIRVSVAAGKYYYGDGYLDRLSRVVLKPEEYPGDYWWNNYLKLAEKKYGLDMYEVAGDDPEGKPARESNKTTDIYLERDANGKVETHITCRHAHKPYGVDVCDMAFSLEPKAQVGVRVGFRRGLLSEWQRIKVSARDLLLSFEIKESEETNLN